MGMIDTRLGGRPRTVPGHPDPPGTIGDGGLWTSIIDLTTWLTSLNRHAFGAEVAQLTEQPGRLDDRTGLDYAWGERVVRVPEGRLITHGGSWAGWLAKTVRCPEQGVAVAVLSHGGTEESISALGVDVANTVIRPGRPG